MRSQSIIYQVAKSPGTHYRSQYLTHFRVSAGIGRSYYSTMADQRALLKPAARVTGQKLDVWYVKEDLLCIAVFAYLSELSARIGLSEIIDTQTRKTSAPSQEIGLTASRTIVNEAAAASPKQPIVNMGQGFFGYNPPKFILDAAKAALDTVDGNQYSPTKGRPRLRKAIADAYSPSWGRKLNPETEVTITTGANEGMINYTFPEYHLNRFRDVERIHGFHRRG